MRVLGVDIQAADVIAIAIEGTSTDGVIDKLCLTRSSFPQIGADEADNLLLFETQLVTMIGQCKVECVGIVKGTGGKYSASPIKFKIECLVQLAAKRNNVQCELVPPQRITAMQKRAQRTGRTSGKPSKHLIRSTPNGRRIVPGVCCVANA
jgi:hypothetical protein